MNIPTESLALDGFKIYDLPSIKEKITPKGWQNEDVERLNIDTDFLSLPWHLQSVNKTIVCTGKANGYQDAFVPDNSVIHLYNHRGQVNMNVRQENSVVDPIGRFKHNGEIQGSEWPKPGWFNFFSFVCSIAKTDGTGDLFLRNPDIPGYGGASIDNYWNIGELQGGYFRIWFNDTNKTDNTGQFEQEMTIYPASAFLKRYSTVNW